ncbi:PR5-like receptor kinase [Corylus avellana]|uniref:PR5-like receptor kinase n=1 Tax=Corylus avellana TaxID=13451 RepID=UPI00286A7329|nr:PR5-like receptor kinase [Corylus avellana]
MTFYLGSFNLKCLFGGDGVGVHADGKVRSRLSGSGRKGRKPISARKGGDVLGDIGNRILKKVTPPCEQRRNVGMTSSRNQERQASGVNSSNTPANQVTTSGSLAISWNGQAVVRFELFSGAASEISQSVISTGADQSNSKRGLKVIIALVTLSAGIGVLMVTICCCFKRKLSSSKIICFWKKENQNHKNIEAFLRNNGPLAIRRYSYSDIKKMTNFFRDKLGEGGFAGVYKGKLQDGSFVAVKVLKESKGNGEEFINEVASISRTSHVNIVTLMGFCFEGSKRTLIYEFMPNGSLEKFIYKENRSKANCQLEWETIYKIALGIARGLEYLHRGCNTRILHFDIKPHNILLDENFCPKISDFGLAKICSKEESIISMLGARGTIGYVAPELVCRNIGGVSHKSDVYSYGMMVLEMVGGRKNIDIRVDHSSELFFPHWIYKRLELDEELGLEGVMNEEDQERARKMIIVSLWCIQTDPSNRPPMSKVVNMLEGSLDSLQIPPKPFFSSPPRSLTDLSTTTETSQEGEARLVGDELRSTANLQ